MADDSIKVRLREAISTYTGPGHVHGLLKDSLVMIEHLERECELAWSHAPQSGIPTDVAARIIGSAYQSGYQQGRASKGEDS